MHFVEQGVSSAKAPPTVKQVTEEGVGICRRYPPRLFVEGEDLFSGFPRIHELHSCGEWATEVPFP